MIHSFDFGLNWKSFSEDKLDAIRIDRAIQSLKNLLGCETLQDRNFMDVGCGSGVFSIAASNLGAAFVIGVDVNPRCITVCESNRNRLLRNGNIAYRQLSALDEAKMRSLGLFDVVYAWGSLHHTGAMWDAIRITAQQVCPEGMFVLAIYNKHWTSPIWERIKWFYNRIPQFGQRLMTIFFAVIIYVAKFLVTRHNPLNKERGMDFWYDVIDWIGGYPYEYATPSEVENFVTPLGFELKRFISAQVPTGCNEFVFTRKIL